MSFTTKHLRIINNLLPIAEKSTISYRLAAAMVSGSKIIGRPMCNSPNTYCRGKYMASEHAEAAAIRSFYGKSLIWSDSMGWCVLRDKGQSAKVA